MWKVILIKLLKFWSCPKWRHEMMNNNCWRCLCDKGPTYAGGLMHKSDDNSLNVVDADGVPSMRHHTILGTIFCCYSFIEVLFVYLLCTSGVTTSLIRYGTHKCRLLLTFHRFLIPPQNHFDPTQKTLKINTCLLNLLVYRNRLRPRQPRHAPTYLHIHSTNAMSHGT